MSKLRPHIYLFYDQFHKALLNNKQEQKALFKEYFMLVNTMDSIRSLLKCFLRY